MFEKVSRDERVNVRFAYVCVCASKVFLCMCVCIRQACMHVRLETTAC